MPTGGGNAGSGVDKEFNSRIAGMSEQEHAWAQEYMNLYKFGNTEGVDRNEQIQGYWEGDNFVELKADTSALKNYRAGDKDPVSGQTMDQNQADSWNAIDAYNAPKAAAPEGKELVTTTRGEAYNIGPSFMEMEQQQIADNMAIMPYQKETTIAGLQHKNYGYETDKMSQEQARRLMVPGTDFALEKIASERKLLPGQTKMTGAGYDYMTDKYNADKSLIPGQTNLRGALNTEALENVGMRKPVTAKFYNEALKGVDVGKRQDQAGAEVHSSFANAESANVRNMSRYGINPNSGRGRNMFSETGMQRAGAVAGARNLERDRTEKENFGRLVTAVNTRTQPNQAVY